MPSVHWVVRSRAKLMRMRGENCIEASVSVIRRMAKTIDTTVIVDVAITPRIDCTTPGSSWEGNSVRGTQMEASGTVSSIVDSAAPAVPSTSASSAGRIRKPPRSA